MANSRSENINSQWIRVATNVTSITISSKGYSPEEFLITIKVTGQSAPDINTRDYTYMCSRDWAFSSSSGHDIYMKYIGNETGVSVLVQV